MRDTSRVTGLRRWYAAGASCLFAATLVFALSRAHLLRADDQPAVEATAQPSDSQGDKGSADKPGGDKRRGPKGDKPADGQKPDGQKPEGDQPADQNAKDKDKDKEKDKDKGEAPVHRPTEPATPPNPAELKVKPDSDGMVSFSFKSQPWQAVLEWLADISHMSLDWQEVPGGYLDLTTRRKYTVDEARDLVNSILLSKGFTLLRNGEVLIVANLKNLDVSLVPVVLPKELDSRGNYELVRTFFNLDRLQAEPLVEELKPLLSPYAKINALKTTNRLDILETAGNLRRIREVVGTEQGDSGKDHQLREFKLSYARVDDVLASLKQLLGIQDKPAGGPTNPEEMRQQMQQQQQMMQQMQQQAQQGGANAKGPKQQPEEKIYLTINRRENSIMALATPDKLAVIEQAVSLLDVPSASSSSPFANVQRVQIYRLIGADPTPIVNVLKEMGNLDPSTRIEVDAPNKAIIVSGPLVDHVTVRALIEKLDGNARHFEVIQLHKLDADYVAGSIEYLIRGPSKDTSRPRFVFGDYRQPEQSKDGGFQVEADTKNNRLLMRVNDVEMEEIRSLMIKLGEDPFAASAGETMRVIRAAPGRETEQLLDRIKRVWPSISPVPLETEAPQTNKSNDAPANKSPEKSKSNKSDDSTKGDQPQENKQPAAPQQHTENKPTATAVWSPKRKQFVYTSGTADSPNYLEGSLAETSNQRGTDESNGNQTANQPATNEPGANPLATNPSVMPAPAGPADKSVSIVEGPQGLIVTSRDPATLDQMMKLIDELSPLRSRFHVFTLKHTYARDVVALLQKIYPDEEQTTRPTNPFFWDFDQQPKEKERNRLSKRDPLKFVPDPVSNSVLVQGADEKQLSEIQSLIDFYDRAEPPDSESIRHTKIVGVHYAKAQQVADVLKDVYRDLLSPNDKALGSNQPQQGQQRERPFWSLFDMGNSSQTTDNIPKFKGLLSIGVDANSNSLVVSAPQFLLTDVVAMIGKLDESTKPEEPVVRVLSVGGALNDPIIKEALQNVADPSSAKHSASRSQDDQRNRGDRNGNGRNGNGRNGNGRNGNGWNNGGNGGNGGGGGGDNNGGQNNNR